MAKLITYAFTGEGFNKLQAENKISARKIKTAAKIACNFWNAHIVPNKNIVLQIDVFYGEGALAYTYKPFEKADTRYVKIEYNANKIWFTSNVAIVFMHEIAHGLGFGWETLDRLYDKTTGKVHQEFVDQILELSEMEIELDYGPATQYAHWDEQKFNNELMTGIMAMAGTYILPVTVKTMRLFGHRTRFEPTKKLQITDRVIKRLEEIPFDRQKDVKLLDTLYFEKTKQVEVVAAKHWLAVLWDYLKFKFK